MANRRVMVAVNELDIHDQLPNGDILVDDQDRRYLVEGDTSGLISPYATLADAIADTANLVNGQLVVIAGGADVGGLPNDDRGIWRVVSNQGAARADYTKVLDITNKASELYVDDVGNFFTGTDAEAALQEIGTKQVFYKLGSPSLTGSVNGATSTALNAAIAALVIDSGSQTDATGAGTSTVVGIVQDAAYSYQIPIRNASTRDVIDDGSGNEVYARLSCPGGVYTLTFYSYVAGVETAYTFAAPTAIDIGYVLVSQDFMRLPAHAGVVQGEFFGDQAGAVGSVSDTQVSTTGPFSGLLNGLTTQSAVNVKVDELGLSGTGQGASLIALEDAAGNFAVDNVEAALVELNNRIGSKIVDFTSIAAAQAAAPHSMDTYIVIEGSGDPTERGIWQVTSGDGSNSGDYTKVLDVSHTAAEVLIANVSGKFTGSEVEAALDELITAIGGASTTNRDFSSNVYVSDNDSLVVAIGKLDAAIGALSSDKLLSMAFTANEAIAAATNGPRLVSQDGAAWKVNLAVAGATGPKVEIVGFATGADYAANAAINQGQGLVSTGLLGGFTGLTPGVTYYADPASNGGITPTVPSVVGQWIIPVGVAVSATSLLVRIGEPNEIVPAQPALQRAVHFKSTAGVAGGLGETGYAVAVGDLWIDNDVAVQNPTKNGLGRYTVYVCKVAWTGAGAALTSGNVNTNFQSIGKQN